jgi:hypothetical protein
MKPAATHEFIRHFPCALAENGGTHRIVFATHYDEETTNHHLLAITGQCAFSKDSRAAALLEAKTCATYLEGAREFLRGKTNKYDRSCPVREFDLADVVRHNSPQKPWRSQSEQDQEKEEQKHPKLRRMRALLPADGNLQLKRNANGILELKIKVQDARSRWRDEFVTVGRRNKQRHWTSCPVESRYLPRVGIGPGAAQCSICNLKLDTKGKRARHRTSLEHAAMVELTVQKALHLMPGIHEDQKQD